MPFIFPTPLFCSPPSANLKPYASLSRRSTETFNITHNAHSTNALQTCVLLTRKRSIIRLYATENGLANPSKPISATRALQRYPLGGQEISFAGSRDILFNLQQISLHGTDEIGVNCKDCRKNCRAAEKQNADANIRSFRSRLPYGHTPFSNGRYE